MEFRGIRQTSHIGGVNRNPDLPEHDKTLVWDNNLKKIKYVAYNNIGINTKLFNGIVLSGDSASSSKYIWKLDNNKNPGWRSEEFLKTVSKQIGGTSGIFTMNSGDVHELKLGSLAWEDSINTSISLPGNSRVLFDDNNIIGGSSSFLFNKTNKTLDLLSFTGIQFKNNADSTYKGVLQYFGNKNLLLGHGVTRTLSWGDNLVNNIFIGDTAGGSSITAQNCLFLGHLSGANNPNNTQGGLYLGHYSGRLENENNKFYIGNANYSTINDFRNNSLMYGDFSTGYLRINNRLEVPQEVKIGTFDILNTPTWGMLQFIGTGTPNEYKPQFYDGFAWQDFASGSNYYLNEVTKGTADVGTTSNDYKLTFDMNGIPDFTLQLGANAFNSNVIPTAMPVDAYGYLQLSSGDIDDGNRGFTKSNSLYWDDVDARLTIDGDLILGEMDLGGSGAGSIRHSNGHLYGFTMDVDGNYVWNRLDADPSGIGENNTASNIGSTGLGLYLSKLGVDLRFKNITPIDSRILLVDNAVSNSIDIDVDINPTAVNITPLTVKTYSGGVLGSILNPTTANPELRLKKLISDTITITENANEVILETTGVGGGESNTALNVGTGISLYKDKVGAALRFKTLTSSGDHINITSNGDGNHLDINVDDIVLNDLGAGVFSIYQGVDSFELNQRTFVNGTATTVDSVDGNTVQYNVSKSIPAFTFIPVPEAIPDYGHWTLNWKANYSSDIRTSGSLTATTMMTLKTGAGLSYDSKTNTLSALSANASTTDYRLSSVTRSTNDLVFHVTDEVGFGVEETVNYTLGELAFNDYVLSTQSIIGSGIAGNPIRLYGDEEDPGVFKYYGTNADGNKGYYDLGDTGSAVQFIGSGDGMDFEDFNSAGYIILGTPSTLTPLTINESTGTTHTHEIETENALLTLLLDCPPSYDTYGGKILAVKSTEDGVEFIDPGALTDSYVTNATFSTVSKELTLTRNNGLSSLVVSIPYDESTGWQPLNTYLTDISNLSGSGLLRKTSTNIIIDNTSGWNTGYQDLSGANPTFNPDNGLNFRIAPTVNTTVTLTNLVAGMSGNISAISPSAGWNITFSGYTIKVSQAVYAGINGTVITSGSGKFDKFSWEYDGYRVWINGQLEFL